MAKNEDEHFSGTCPTCGQACNCALLKACKAVLIVFAEAIEYLPTPAFAEVEALRELRAAIEAKPHD